MEIDFRKRKWLERHHKDWSPLELSRIYMRLWEGTGRYEFLHYASFFAAKSGNPLNHLDFPDDLWFTIWMGQDEAT